MLQDSTGHQQKYITIPSYLCWLCFRPHILTRENSRHLGAFLGPDFSQLLRGRIESDWERFAKLSGHDSPGKFHSFPAFVGLCLTFFASICVALCIQRLNLESYTTTLLFTPGGCSPGPFPFPLQKVCGLFNVLHNITWTRAVRWNLWFFHPYSRRLETLTADDSSKSALRLLKDPGTLNNKMACILSFPLNRVIKLWVLS